MEMDKSNIDDKICREVMEFIYYNPHCYYHNIEYFLRENNYTEYYLDKHLNNILEHLKGKDYIVASKSQSEYNYDDIETTMKGNKYLFKDYDLDKIMELLKPEKEEEKKNIKEEVDEDKSEYDFIHYLTYDEGEDSEMIMDEGIYEISSREDNKPVYTLRYNVNNADIDLIDKIERILIDYSKKMNGTWKTEKEC